MKAKLFTVSKELVAVLDTPRWITIPDVIVFNGLTYIFRVFERTDTLQYREAVVWRPTPQEARQEGT